MRTIIRLSAGYVVGAIIVLVLAGCSEPEQWREARLERMRQICFDHGFNARPMIDTAGKSIMTYECIDRTAGEKQQK